MSTGIFNALGKAASQRRSLLCIGLDPRIDPSVGSPRDAIVEANRRIVGETAELALAYKPNIAFYERFGPAGIEALIETLKLIPDEVFTILDAKRGDIGSTAESYAAAVFDTLGVDFVTLSPYLGSDSIEPFLEYDNRGLFVLCRTSNPSAGQVQDVDVAGRPLYQSMADEILSWGDSVGLVVAGNDTDALAILRAQCPDAWFLAPGIGAQGGAVGDAIAAGVNDTGTGILPTVSRGIAGATDPRMAAKQYRDDIQQSVEDTLSRRAGRRMAGLRAGESGEARALQDRVIEGLFDHQCFQLGEFVLKSGQVSPFYVDLRRAVVSPSFMRTLAAAYASLAAGLQYDRLAGIPVAALPLATALSLAIDRPLIYPRIPPKPHGSGRPIEGAYETGETILLVDDLITTGGSKVEAISVLESEGLRVEHLVVLLERGRQGRADMNAHGVELRSFLQIETVVERGRALGFLTADDEKRIIAFLGE